MLIGRVGIHSAFRTSGWCLGALVDDRLVILSDCCKLQVECLLHEAVRYKHKGYKLRMAYRPTEKTEARKKAQHALLLNTSLAIVARDGFESLTIASLAQDAKVAVGTVYKYFESKSVLCAEVFRLGTEKEVAQVQAAAFPEDVNGSCEERLKSALRTFSLRAIAGRRLAYALIAEPVDALVQEERLKYRRAYADIFARLIAEGVAKGEFKDQDPLVSAAALVGLLAETLLGPIGSAIDNDTTVDKDDLIAHIMNFCLRAVGATST